MKLYVSVSVYHQARQEKRNIGFRTKHEQHELINNIVSYDNSKILASVATILFYALL